MENLMVALVLFVTLLFTNSINTLPNNNISHFHFRFTSIDEINLKELSVDFMEESKFQWITQFKARYQQAKQQEQNFRITLQNLFTVIEKFQSNQCIVVDNWQNMDIRETIEIPLMLRTLELALYHRKYHVNSEWNNLHEWENVEKWDVVLLPNRNTNKHKNFSELEMERNKYINCSISKFYSPITPDNILDSFCIDLNFEMFTTNIKPWQCEIHVNLLMPKRFLKSHISQDFLNTIVILKTGAIVTAFCQARNHGFIYL